MRPCMTSLMLLLSGRAKAVGLASGLQSGLCLASGLILGTFGLLSKEIPLTFGLTTFLLDPTEVFVLCALFAFQFRLSFCYSAEFFLDHLVRCSRASIRWIGCVGRRRQDRSDAILVCVQLRRDTATRTSTVRPSFCSVCFCFVCFCFSSSSSAVDHCYLCCMAAVLRQRCHGRERSSSALDGGTRWVDVRRGGTQCWLVAAADRGRFVGTIQHRGHSSVGTVKGAELFGGGGVVSADEHGLRARGRRCVAGGWTAHWLGQFRCRRKRRRR
mmetsp:Transcript_6409/g.19440  ORF Transcript_6409/g.19440 Transcript_6409/m.19440 type:complete len:271 (-) Transcript_6409:611-1423(-)